MLKYIRLVFQSGFHILYCYFKWMRKYSRHPERYPFKERYDALRECARHLSRNCRLDMRIEGLEKLNGLKKATLIVPNHLSMMDIVVLIAISEQPLTFVAKIENKKAPFVGRCLRALDGLFLPRDDVRASLKVIGTASEYLAANKCHVVLYPEGTRNKEPFTPTKVFHPGSFKIAYRGKADILPVASFGTQRILKKRPNYKSNPIQFAFGDIMKYEDYSKDNTTVTSLKAHDYVASQVQIMIERDKEYFAKGYQNEYAPDPKWWQSYLPNE